jgi:hypothetical protein
MNTQDLLRRYVRTLLKEFKLDKTVLDAASEYLKDREESSTTTTTTTTTRGTSEVLVVARTSAEIWIQEHEEQIGNDLSNSEKNKIVKYAESEYPKLYSKQKDKKHRGSVDELMKKLDLKFGQVGSKDKKAQPVGDQDAVNKALEKLRGQSKK